MDVREQAEELLDEAQLYGDDDQPMHTLAEVAVAYDVPLHAARQVCSDLEVPLVGGTYAMTYEGALDVGEELDARGWALGPDCDDEEDEAEEDDEVDEDEDDEDDDDLDEDDDEDD